MTFFAAAVLLAETSLLPIDGNGFHGAAWIGEADEKEMSWREEDAKRCRGITGAKGHEWIGLTSPLPKHCPRFRKTFALGAATVSKAVASVSGMGFYELWINGRKADPMRVLAPGMTSGDRVLADRYDVTALLRPGRENTIGLWLAPGYSDDFTRYGWYWLAPKRAILALAVETVDGGKTTVVTDGTWETTPESPILSASIYHGEIYDAAKEDAAWCMPSGKKDGWRAVTVFPDGPPLRFNGAPPVRMSDPRQPDKIVETAPGVFTVDFGQNRAGFVALRAKGPKGTKIKVRTSELLGSDGKIDPWTNGKARSTDEFTLAGTGVVEEYVPRFTYHGFRYAEITGWPGHLAKEDVTAWAVHADVKAASTFRCSDATLMKLHDAARWSMLSNFMSYPTDCCMRGERTPCLMDSQTYEDTACQFFDMCDYYEKWLDDIDGRTNGNPDWTGDAAALPFRLWRHYGDDNALARRLANIERYVDALLKRNADFIFTDGFGDWCAPNDGTWKGYFNDVGVVNSALFCSILVQMAEAERHFGNAAEAKSCHERFEAAKAAFNRKFYDNATHTYGDGSQTTSVLPLAFGLVPEGERSAVAAQLVARIRGKDGGKIDTGIYGTRYIGEVLCDIGECDLLVDMYTQTNYPGFGYMFANGATTLWEQWSFKGDMNSHNHAMFSGGAEWLYSRLAGIRPLKPGYSEVLVKPCYPRKISFVEATRLTPHGEVKVRWDRRPDGIAVRVFVPGGVSCAAFEFPDGRRVGLRKGDNEVRVDLPSVQKIWPDGKIPDCQGHQSVPTLEWFFPERRTSDAVVIVAPGGAYNVLTGYEGKPICEYFNGKGTTAVLLRYRIPRPEGLAKHQSAWDDVQRTIRCIRAMAPSLGLDAEKIGMLGFSAGGHLTLLSALSSRTNAYAPFDSIDEVPCHLNFAVPVYPAYVVSDDDTTLAKELMFDAGTPPMCLIHGDKDSYTPMGSVAVYRKLRKLSVPAEMHIYAETPHGFGMNFKLPPGSPAGQWINGADAWRKFMGFGDAPKGCPRPEERR